MLTLGMMVLLVVAGILYVQILLRHSAAASAAPSAAPSAPMPSPTVVALAPSMSSGDSRYDRAPQPLRDWRAIPELPPRGGISALPFNIPTQGLPESFQSVGVINVNDQMLPLYGRRTAGGSDRWNYYTRTDTYNPVPLPVTFQKRNCMDGVGCSEMMSGESVVVDGLQKEGKAQLYRMDGPTYLPGIL
jgi:hypothetical protein